MGKPFEKKTYYALTLDPVHVGTGGYRLGRVDNTIVREPGTNLPKVPGSSIAGVARTFTALALQSDVEIEAIREDHTINFTTYKKCKYLRPSYQFIRSDDKNISFVNENRVIVEHKDGAPLYENDPPSTKEKFASCAGKGGGNGTGHCGESDCAVCISYGFSHPNNSFQGLTQFSDARIIFFPVHTMIGPVWITSESILSEFGCSDCRIEGDTFKAINNPYRKPLNFGWLMLEPGSGDPCTVDFSQFSTTASGAAINEIKEKAFVVPNKIFTRIVNDNLEVRTSVAIDPTTGTAADGALFTYEAIPRATLLWFDVFYSNPDFFRVKGTQQINLPKPDGYEDPLTVKEDQLWFMAHYVEKGLGYLASLGVGGMNTRGMGRVKILNLGR